MSKAGYSYKWCYICGKQVSTSGGAVNHWKMHVREGKMQVNVQTLRGKGETFYTVTPGVTIITEKMRAKEEENDNG